MKTWVGKTLRARMAASSLIRLRIFKERGARNFYMHRSRAIISLVALAVLSNAAPARAACKPETSAIDRAFGIVELGASKSDLPKDAEPLGCNTLTQEDCTFFRHVGVVYQDSGTGIVGKSLDAQASNIKVLPFGLSQFDKVRDVINKVRSVWRGSLKVKKVVTMSEPDTEEIVSGYCYKNGRGKIFAIRIQFYPWGQIASFSTFTQDRPSDVPDS